MDWNKASSIAEVLSSIAILVTLFYLAVEIQQGAEATRAQTRQAILESDQQLLEMLVDDPGLSALWYKSALSDHEKIRMSYFLVLFVRMRESNWVQYKNGTLDEETWNAYRGTILAIFTAKNPRKWWENFGKERVFGNDIIAVIDDMLIDAPVVEKSPHLTSFD